MILVPLDPASVAFTGRGEGDMGSLAERGPAGPSPAVEERRRAVAARPWTWLRQVHGAEVVEVVAPGAHAGVEADGAVGSGAGIALAILTADCAPIGLASPEGVLGAAHAGWRGLAAGVIAETVSAMRSLGATEIEAVIGPCIHPGCYEFSPRDLDIVASRLGDEVRSQTASGQPALDLPGAVRGALAQAGAHVVYEAPACTACDLDASGEPAWFSHRARGDESRQAMVVWCR